MGSAQTWNAKQYREKTGFVAEYGRDLLHDVPQDPAGAVVDLGCGDGRLSVQLADHCRRDVIGIDLSESLLAAINDDRIMRIQADGHDLPLRDRCAGVVFSNAALHWMTRPARVIAQTARVLTDGGVFVGEFGGAQNIAIVRRALFATARHYDIAPETVDPWYFPDAQTYRALLHRHGFRVSACFCFARPTPLPDSIDAWLAVFAKSFFAPLRTHDRQDFIARTRESLRRDLQNPDGSWYVDYVRLRFLAHRARNIDDKAA